MACLLSACSASQSTPSHNRFNPAKESAQRASINWEIEHYTTKDLALQEIMKTPTEFPILFEEDYYVWERAKIFIMRYTKGIAWEDETSGIFVMSSDAENNEEPFHYLISKKMNPDGYTYKVACLTWEHAETPDALLNAKNLSRFMRRGELEADLLVGS